MYTISIISLKGGVAKTTTAINMAYVMAKVYGKKVLLIDNDKQGNASKAFGLYDPEDEDTIARAMMERELDPREIIKNSKYENIKVITANMSLLEANMRTIIDTGRQQQTRFKKTLAAVQDQFDICIIDNAPDINMSIVNALTMSNDVIVPIMIDQYSFDGLKVLFEQIKDNKEDFNQSLTFRGCLVTQYQNNDVTKQGIEILKKKWNVPVFEQTIRRTEKKVNESTFVQMPVVEYSVRCGASQDYKKFVDEVIQNVPNLGKNGVTKDE